MDESGTKEKAFDVAGPQGICEIIGLSFRVWRENLKFMVKAFLVPTIFISILGSIFALLITYGPTASTNFFQAVMIFFTGVIVGIAVIGVNYVLVMRQLAMVRLLCGFAPDWQSAQQFMQKRFWWIIGLTCLSLFALILIFCVWGFIIGFSAALHKFNPLASIMATTFIIFALCGALISIVIFCLLTAVGGAVLAIEEVDFWGVVNRSFYWTFHQFGRVSCFFLVYYVVVSVVAMPVKLPMVAVSLGDMIMQQISSGGAQSETYKAPVYVIVFNQIWASFSSMLLQPVLFLCLGFLYRDLRNRTNGLDIVCRLKSLQSTKT